MALEWTNRPERSDVERKYQWVKAPAKGILRCRILSPELMVTRVHYFKGRSRGHDLENCRACAAGNPPRWTGFAFCCLPGERRIRILQVPGFIADQLYGERCRLATLKNLAIQLSRKNEKPNGEVFLKIEGVYDNAEFNPKVPLIAPILERTWEQNILWTQITEAKPAHELRPTGTEGRPQLGIHETELD